MIGALRGGLVQVLNISLARFLITAAVIALAVLSPAPSAVRWSFWAGHAQATPTIVREPYLQQVTAIGAIIVWATREGGTAEVRFSSDGAASIGTGAESSLFSATTTGMGADYYQHVARLSGLVPGTVYRYDILVGGIDLNSVADTFRTAPATGTGAVTFIAFGDSGTGSTAQRQLGSLMERDSFDFSLHSGDLAYGFAGGTGTATFQTTHDWFFAIYSNWLRARPMFPTNGNHDSRADNNQGLPYRSLFVLPTNGASAAYPDHAERYYSFDYGPLHVVALDTEFAFLDPLRRSAQLAWLEEDLAATTQPWKVAVYHRSPYSAGGEHGSEAAVREAFAPIFERHGVQLAIGGHEHDYERTWPLRADTRQAGGVTYVVTGGGGGPLYRAGTAAWTAFSASRYHYVRTSATDCTLRLEAVGIDGSIFDTFSTSRCTPPPDTTPPVVSITGPAPGASVRGATAVTVTATDDTGVGATELLVDGGSVGQDSAFPFGFTWDSATVPNGSYRLQVTARDFAGNTAISAPVAVTVANSTAGPGDIVLYAGDQATRVVGTQWVREADLSAAGGVRLRDKDAGAPKRTAALAQPADYFEIDFTAPAGAYHLWVRGKADGNAWQNDSVFVQFSDITGALIGSTGAAVVNLEECGGCSVAGWGWQDNGYGLNAFGPHLSFTRSGEHTLRVQTREDGLSIDQLILSPQAFRSVRPGSAKNDSNIYRRTAGTAPSADTVAPVVTIASPASGATVKGTSSVTVNATDAVGVVRVELFVDDALAGTASAGPYTFSWNTTVLDDGAHALQARAFDAANNMGRSPVGTVTVANTVAAGPRMIVLHTADAPLTRVVGNWRRELDASAASGALLHNPNAGVTKLAAALAAPRDYFEMSFTAEANVPYHLWIRSRAAGNYWGNDSVFVQFSNVAGARIGTTLAASVNLEDCSGCGIAGWGWQDNGYATLGPDLVFSEGGTQTVRIQPREDGLSIDQIVLSPVESGEAPRAPGSLKNDNTRLEK